jgi:pseudouridine-5'-phosphate glycosidase
VLAPLPMDVRDRSTSLHSSHETVASEAHEQFKMRPRLLLSSVSIPFCYKLADQLTFIDAQSKLPVLSGIHFANPVPLEASVPKPEMDRVIEEAVRLADVEGYHGSDNTPFVLAKIKELSGGKSVIANRALIENNVQRATRVAVELAKLEEQDRGSGSAAR